MASEWDVEVLDQPGLELSMEEKGVLQSELCTLGQLSLNPLPNYQVFERDSGHALDDKVIVLVRTDNILAGFASAILLPIDGLEKPVVHTGLTVIHPDYRKTGVMQVLFANLFFYLLAKNPEGIWCTTTAGIISSLVQMSLYTTQAYPSPQWANEHPDGGPSPTHLLIATELNKRHRQKMLISADAIFEEDTFVIRGANDSAEAKVFWKDVDTPLHWHRDREQSVFYRNLLRRDKGDEVLLVSFLELEHLERHQKSKRFKGVFDELSAKI